MGFPLLAHVHEMEADFRELYFLSRGHLDAVKS